MNLCGLLPCIFNLKPGWHVNLGERPNLPHELFFSNGHSFLELVFLVHIGRRIPRSVEPTNSLVEVSTNRILSIFGYTYPVVNGVNLNEEPLIELLINLLKLPLFILQVPYLHQYVWEDLSSVVFVDESCWWELDALGLVVFIPVGGKWALVVIVSLGFWYVRPTHIADQVHLLQDFLIPRPDDCCFLELKGVEQHSCC